MKRVILTLIMLEVIALQAAEIPLPEVRVPLRRGEIKINGEGNDPGWKNAAVIRLDKGPIGTAPEKKNTNRSAEVRLTYDSSFLYVSFFCLDSEVLPAGEKRDDKLHAGDVVEIFIDGTGDGRQFYEIQLNAKALVRDVNYLFTGKELKLNEHGICTDMGNMWDDPAFNLAELKVAAKLLPEGYRVECAIPAKDLMRRRGKDILTAGDRLRANFVQLDYEKDGSCVMSYWSATMAGRPHRSPGRMGTLIMEN